MNNRLQKIQRLASNHNGKKKNTAATVSALSVVAGAAIGAAAVYLKDKKNRKKVEKVLHEITSHGEKLLHQGEEKTEDLKQSLPVKKRTVRRKTAQKAN